MDADVQTQFLKNLALGIAEKAGIAGGTWLIAEHLLPDSQLTNAEQFVGGIVMFAMVAGYTWWRSYGQAKVMQIFKMQPPPGYVPDPNAPVSGPVPSA